MRIFSAGIWILLQNDPSYALSLKKNGSKDCTAVLRPKDSQLSQTSVMTGGVHEIQHRIAAEWWVKRLGCSSGDPRTAARCSRRRIEPFHVTHPRRGTP